MDVEAFPAAMLVRFFRNHGQLGLTGQHQWWTVKGGSIEYVRRLERRLAADGVRIALGAPVRSVVRAESGCVVHTAGHAPAAFDQVVFACHAEQALALLDRPTAAEARLLGSFRTRANRAVLHRDPGQMPRRRECWSSWVYRASVSRPMGSASPTG